MKTTIWTRAARDLLYEALVARFGRYEKGWPSAARRKEFEQFCEDFAALIGAKSGMAVQHQVRWATGVDSAGERHWSGDHTRNAVLNMASAFEAGFISHGVFPAVVARRDVA